MFENSSNINELYKIHGSVKEPDSIVITGKDYNALKRTSAILNAKILSKLTESPILFLGYSLTDESIRSLLKDLSDNVPESINIAERICVVEYQKDEQSLDEKNWDTGFGVYCSKISTDNFKEIYKMVSKVDQGISPNEISKYESAIKQIIEIKGRQGELDQVLTSFVDLNNLPEELKRKNLVVAFGENRYLYKYPDFIDYIKSYFFDDADIPPEIAMKFIVRFSSRSTLPVSKYVVKIGNGINISEKEKEKINKRLNRFKTIESLKVNNLTENRKKLILSKIDFSNPESVFRNDVIKPRDSIAYLIKNINTYSREIVLDLIKYIIEKEENGFINETNCKKLFMAYSLTYESIPDAI